MERENLLKKLRQYWLQNKVPNITDVNARFLRDLIKIKWVKNMLEIGTANGFSAINFWIELEKNNWNLITIEFSPNSYDEAKKNVKEANLKNVITLILWNALDEIPKQKDDFFDFVFIDGMKKRSKDFLELSWSKVKNGGIIIIDDVIKFREKMVNLYEFLEKQKIEYNVLPIDLDDWIMMIIKN